MPAPTSSPRLPLWQVPWDHLGLWILSNEDAGSPVLTAQASPWRIPSSSEPRLPAPGLLRHPQPRAHGCTPLCKNLVPLWGLAGNGAGARFPESHALSSPPRDKAQAPGILCFRQAQGHSGLLSPNPRPSVNPSGATAPVPCHAVMFNSGQEWEGPPIMALSLSPLSFHQCGQGVGVGGPSFPFPWRGRNSAARYWSWTA